jgi:hypothetical protein
MIMSVETGYTFDLNGTLVSAPIEWHIETLPYRLEHDRWVGHVGWCGQCAQHQCELANTPQPVTPPCATGAKLLADLSASKSIQRVEALRN